MRSNIFLTGLMSLVMANASLAPVLANPVNEQKATAKQEIQSNAAENSVVLTPATKDTPGAVQIVPIKDYIALKGEANLEGKQILEVMPQTSARNKNDKDSGNNNKSSLTPEADYFVVLPQGQELSAKELEKVEGEVAWWVVAGGTLSIGATVGVGVNAYQNVQAGRPWHQNWGSSAVAGVGAVSCAWTGGANLCGDQVKNFWNNRRSGRW